MTGWMKVDLTKMQMMDNLKERKLDVQKVEMMVRVKDSLLADTTERRMGRLLVERSESLKGE